MSFFYCFFLQFDETISLFLPYKFIRHFSSPIFSIFLTYSGGFECGLNKTKLISDTPKKQLVMKFKVNILLLVFLMMASAGWSQEKWTGNLFLGGSSYMGDLVHSSIPYLDQTKLSFGLGATYSIKPSIGVRFGFLHSGIKGDDAIRGKKTGNMPTRNVSFSTGINELAAVVKWDFLNSGDNDMKISPYLFGGLGLDFINVDADYSKTPSDLSTLVSQDKANTDNSTFLAIPLGAGVSMKMNDQMSLGLEIGLRKGFSDILDGVSALGNADKNDFYTTFGLTLDYRFANNDQDKDGIVDDEDQCPEVFGAATANGCPDADGDGVKDAMDKCPNTAGLVKMMGCPDTDNDGVVDNDDACPNTPGTLNGCPDTDKDGISDKMEAKLGTDPNNPDTDGDGLDDGVENKNKNGMVDAGESDPLDACDPLMKGDNCDSDGDGVVNSMDACPNKAGAKANGGCPDTDGDGVVDKDDRCPNVAGTKGNRGCPEVKKEVQETLNVAVKNVQFQTSSANLLEKSNVDLDKIVKVMNDYPYYSLRISGHTDNRGNKAFNQELSEKRAKACFDYLVSHGISADRMTHAGYGETQPIATNNTAAGRLQNRRVMFELFVK